MNLFINTTISFSDKILNNYFIQQPFHIIQIDCLNKQQVIHYIEKNNGDDFSLINNIKNIKDMNNELINKLCLLYLYGGIIINANILLKNIQSILYLYENNNVCVIKSYITNKIFDGIIIAKKGNKELLNIINTYFSDININISDLLLSQVITDKELQNKILNEQIIGEKSNIYGDHQEIIAEHYFKITTLLEKFKLTNHIPNNLTKLKIGITTNIPPNLKDFYSNGIKQNCLYLYELLKNTGYDVKLVIDSDKNISVLKEIDFYEFEYITIHDIFTYDFDIVFSMGFSIPQHIFHGLKNIGTKIIYYMCGNNYLIDAEKILYNQHKTRTIHYGNDQNYDQIWIIPQMYNQNKYYAEILQKTKCIQIPFIWSPMSIQFIKKMLNLKDDTSLMYKKKESKIAIFEPNISIMKWALPCILIAENTHRTYKNIKHVYITNLNKSKDSDINHFNTEEFNNVCRGLDLFKERKLSSESRFNTLEFMSKHCDIAISHQWENPLNYLYLDLAWMGWPILHNAYLCKDVGYYYEGFNYYEASELLNHILTNHDANVNDYLMKNRKVIDVYIPTNKSLQDKYRNLIENLFT